MDGTLPAIQAWLVGGIHAVTENAFVQYFLVRKCLSDADCLAFVFFLEDASTVSQPYCPTLAQECISR